jgi:hypothetical protein
MIKWNSSCLGEGEPETIKEKLLESKWNPNKTPKASRRKYFGPNKNSVFNSL